MSKTPHEPCGQDHKNCSHEFDSIKCRHLSVEHPDNPAKIVAMANKSYAGLWLSTGRGTEQIGLVSDPNGNTYLCFYTAGRSLPVLAVGVDENDQAFVQVATDGTAAGVRHFALDELLAEKKED